MKKSQARGYLLEIVLSKLIEINGYKVIRVEDEKEIVNRSNGLNLKGRGGFHQFDTLGSFKITPPFVYPLRLFVEAKFYSSPIGIDRVRMGVGILEDVNTNYSTVLMDDEELAIEKYQYHYAIFSTSGFTEDAQRYAIAHKIHLIDLSGDEYREIIELIEQIVEQLDNISSRGNDDIATELFADFKDDFYGCIINGFDSPNDELGELITLLRRRIDDRYIYLATINSPHIIPLLSNRRFHEELNKFPPQKVALTWQDNDPTKWSLIAGSNPDVRVEFTLPKLLLRYMLSDAGSIEDLAMIIKQQKIGKFVFIAYLDEDNPTLCTLTVDRKYIDEILER